MTTDHDNVAPVPCIVRNPMTSTTGRKADDWACRSSVVDHPEAGKGDRSTKGCQRLNASTAEPET